MSEAIPAVILGASGYVGGELLRLVAVHPRFRLAAAVSDSAAGQPVGTLFGHLATAPGWAVSGGSPVLAFLSGDRRVARRGPSCGR